MLKGKQTEACLFAFVWNSFHPVTCQEIVLFFIVSWIRWLIGLHSLMKHHWVALQCEIGQTSVAQWMGSRESPFSLVIPSLLGSFCLESAAPCHQLETKHVLNFSHFLSWSYWPRGANWQVSLQRGATFGCARWHKQLVSILRFLTAHTSASPPTHWLFWFVFF